MLPFVSLCLVLLLACPANSQSVPEASAAAAANDTSSVLAPDLTVIKKEPGKAQPSASHMSGEPVLSEAQALEEGAQTPPGEHEEALRRELAEARAELDVMQRDARDARAQAAKQAQALKEQRRTDEALELDLQTAQRVIESFRTEASRWDNETAAIGAPPAVEASVDAAKQALDDERHKVELLEQELTTARQTIDALKKDAYLATVDQANAIKDRQVAEAALKQAGEARKLERERADSALRELDIVGKEREALEQSSIELSAALDEERERATGLARSLSAARDAIDIGKVKPRAADVERAPKAPVPAGAPASTLSRAGAQPTRKPSLPEKQKAKAQRSPQPVLLTTIDLPAALLPTRPPKKLNRRQ
ncbi:hypothetical protein C7I87_05275 [Mesorhizobium sp. SARCC-RB16n]|nr:hypothetical protein C7I87_05275 [Mesorhizobium sp. SARCC-RB16n]